MTLPIQYEIVYEGNALAIMSKLKVMLDAESLSIFMLGTAEYYIKDRAVRRFKAEGDDASGRWAALKYHTQIVRTFAPQLGYLPEVGPSHPINVRTGELRDYITKSYGEVLPPNKSSVLFTYPGKKAEGELRTKVRFAQRGDKKSKTVARPVLAIGGTDVAYLVTSLELFITRGVALLS